MFQKITVRYLDKAPIRTGDFDLWTCVKMSGSYIIVSSNVFAVRTLVATGDLDTRSEMMVNACTYADVLTI